MDLGREYSACFTPDAGVAESATLEVLRARRLPTDQVAVPQFKTWHSSQMKTGLSNRIMGRKVSFAVRERA
jgi:hypothetical protein